MSKKTIWLGVSLIVLSAGAIGFSNQQEDRKTPGRPRNPAARPVERGSAVIPEHVFYDQMFSSILALKNAEDYREQAALEDAEVHALTRIADECARALALQDAKAIVIIKAFRSRMKTLKPSDALPPPPPELAALQKKRDAIVLQHRDLLQSTLGEAKFTRVKSAAQRIIHIELKALP